MREFCFSSSKAITTNVVADKLSIKIIEDLRFIILPVGSNAQSASKQNNILKNN